MSTQSFSYSGAYEEWVVPAGVRRVTAELWGAQGGPNGAAFEGGGEGGYIKARLRVVPGETLRVYVGGHPAAAETPGWPDGGEGGGSGTASSGGGGGGSTDIRRAPYGLDDRLAVAGGGGGTGGNANIVNPGHGGHPTGVVGNWGNPGVGVGAERGQPGTQTEGGLPDGAFGQGGDQESTEMRGGGGGGGGWYGGGSGASTGVTSFSGAGGGGGSSYAPGRQRWHVGYVGDADALAVLLDSSTGGRTGDGAATLTW